jgi:UDP-GlcNAc3NAcA epimerase
MKKKIIHVVGNRPQFIKLAALYKALNATGLFGQTIVHTGQHSGSEMSEIFFKDLEIPKPSFQLSVGDIFGNRFIAEAIIQLRSYFSKNASHAIAIIYGDTNSTHAAAIAALRCGVELHHIESGVRTFNNSTPEEINRIIADRFSTTHYCCTRLNYDNLKAEGFGTAIRSELLLTGDLMLDAFLNIEEDTTYKIAEADYVACTIHRLENISGENLAEILKALNNIHKQIPVIMPVHPHTRKRMEALNEPIKFITISPLGYRQMKSFLDKARWVITDSGGVTREAFFSNKYSLVIATHPAWPEIIDAGCCIASLPIASHIEDNFSQLPNLSAEFDHTIFGNGDAANTIGKSLLKKLLVNA